MRVAEAGAEIGDRGLVLFFLRFKPRASSRRVFWSFWKIEGLAERPFVFLVVG